MTKKLIAMMLSASLALTSITVTPARADDDVGKVLAGLAALLVIGAAVNKQKHRKEQTVTRHSQPKQWKPVQKQRRHVKAAPQQCLRNQWTHRGNREVYGARCMQRHANAQLPSRCLRQAEVNQGPRRFYTKRCLRKNGWRA